MDEAARILEARRRKAAGLCIANPRPIGCRIVAPIRGSFCTYCERLVDGESVQPSRRRQKRADHPKDGQTRSDG